MTSCEPLRSSAYSEDMRWRIVWQSQALVIPYKEIATNFNIDLSTVKRIVCLFSNTGDVCKRPYPSEKAYRKLNEPVQHFILYLVLARPGIYLHEIVREVSSVLGLDITESAVCKFLQKAGFTHHKLALHLPFTGMTLSANSLCQMYPLSTWNASFCWWNWYRWKRYSEEVWIQPSREAFKSSKVTCAWRAYILYSCDVNPRHRGNKDCQKQCGWWCVLQLCVCFTYNKAYSFNGTNPNSVLILDNCSVHRVDEVHQALGDCGVLTHYLPPYSPDYNPIELAFSKVKYAIKSMKAEMQAINDLETIVLAAFATITTADCQSWINSIGVY